MATPSRKRSAASSQTFRHKYLSNRDENERAQVGDHQDAAAVAIGKVAEQRRAYKYAKESHRADEAGLKRVEPEVRAERDQGQPDTAENVPVAEDARVCVGEDCEMLAAKPILRGGNDSQLRVLSRRVNGIDAPFRPAYTG